MNLEEIVKMIEDEFANVQTKRIALNVIIEKLEEKGIGRDRRDDALHEAQRRKIIRLHDGFYEWIDPNVREGEKAKTQQYFEILASIFKEGKIDFLPEDDVKVALRERGFDDKEIDRILIEAERDYVLTFPSRSLIPEGDLVAGCSWIPPEERERVAEAEKRHRKWLDKWHEKKAEQEGIWRE